MAIVIIKVGAFKSLVSVRVAQICIIMIPYFLGGVLLLCTVGHDEVRRRVFVPAVYYYKGGNEERGKRVEVANLFIEINYCVGVSFCFYCVLGIASIVKR